MFLNYYYLLNNFDFKFMLFHKTGKLKLNIIFNIVAMLNGTFSLYIELHEST